MSMGFVWLAKYVMNYDARNFKRPCFCSNGENMRVIVFNAKVGSTPLFS